MNEKIQEKYNFNFKLQDGKKMMINNVLSRVPIDEAIDVDNVHKKTVTEKMIVNSIMNQDVETICGDHKLNNSPKRANDNQDYIALRSVSLDDEVKTKEDHRSKWNAYKKKIGEKQIMSWL